MLKYIKEKLSKYMYDTDKFLKALNRSQKDIERLTKSPFESMLKQQAQMFQAVTCQNQLTSGLVPLITATAQMQAQHAAMADSLQAVTKKLLSVYEPVLSSIVNTQAPYDSLVSSVQEIARQWNDSTLSVLRDSLTNGLNGTIPNSLASFSSAIEAITIHDNYVDIPESLIPDDFQYAEVSDNSESATNQGNNESSNTKRLSFSDALSIIIAIATLLMWLLAPFYNHAVENLLSKEEDLKTDSLMTEDQAQKIIEYLSELTDCQQSIIAALEVSERLAPEHGSCCCDTPPHSATPSSAYSEIDKLPPTSDDESGNSE